MPNQTTSPVLVEVTRGPEVESSPSRPDRGGGCHRQAAPYTGRPGGLVCLRSLAKPFQALAVLTSGAAKAFGFGAAELALFSGSLSGQDFQLSGHLHPGAPGPEADALQCGMHPPLHRPTAQALVKAGLKPTPLHNTCTGKHAAMLALCVHHGWPIDGLPQSGPPGAGADFGHRGPDGGVSQRADSRWPSTAAAPRSSTCL